MNNNYKKVFQVSTVFIGTIVGAGLASGKEISQFFTEYGFKSFMGIILCGALYVYIGSIISKISVKFNLKSYNELISIICPGFFGVFIDFITGFFLLSGSAIILAASGALLNQYFGLSKWVGIFIMVLFSVLTLINETDGLISINGFIVPALVFTLLLIFLLYVIFYKDSMTITHLASIPHEKNNWIMSTLLYSGFNLLSCSGVLVPLSSELKDDKAITKGIFIGALGLTLLCIFINIMLMLNKPYINLYEIPLLYISNRFGKTIQLLLLLIIWLEMFSTEVSDIYSICKTLQQSFNISFKKGMVLVLLVAIPISQIGFSKLIAVLYPAFGAISMVFIVRCIYFYYTKYNK